MIKVVCFLSFFSLFFLHHANVDWLWWQWQQADPANRLYAYGGNVSDSKNVLSLMHQKKEMNQYTYKPNVSLMFTFFFSIFYHHLVDLKHTHALSISEKKRL